VRVRRCGAGAGQGSRPGPLWSLTCRLPSPARHQDGSLELRAHRLWLATGSLVDARAEPLLAALLAALPVPLCGGMPVLQPDLVRGRVRWPVGRHALQAYSGSDSRRQT
jgi:hypothetical protein